jgi:hypothetical protein
VRHARARRQEPADEEVEAAADAFRLERELYDAAKAENWLADRNVTFAGWMKYIERCLLRQKWQSRLPELVRKYPVSEQRLNRNVRVIGFCSGHFARFARKLAGRAAAAERMRQEGAAGQLTEQLEQQRERAETSFTCSDEDAKLLGLSAEACTETMRKHAGLERGLEQFRRLLIAPAKVERHISARQIEWTRIQARSLSFDTEAEAREAAMCIRDDGEDMSAVAARTRARACREQFDLEDLEAGLQAMFLPVRKGDLIGPLASGKEFKLFLVSDKTMPSAKDVACRSRAEQILLQTALDAEISARVQWQVPWWSDP